MVSGNLEVTRHKVTRLIIGMICDAGPILLVVVVLNGCWRIYGTLGPFLSLVGQV